MNEFFSLYIKGNFFLSINVTRTTSLAFIVRDDVGGEERNFPKKKLFVRGNNKTIVYKCQARMKQDELDRVAPLMTDPPAKKINHFVQGGGESRNIQEDSELSTW